MAHTSRSAADLVAHHGTPAAGPSAMSLPPQLHLHLVDQHDAAILVDAACAWLSEAECKRHAQYKVADKAAQFACSRAALRRILATQLDCAPEVLDFAIGDRGKPFLDPALGWHFNASHSRSFLAIACSPDLPVGIDIERIEGSCDFAGLSRRFFSEDEHRCIMLKKPDEQLRAFYTAWTAKEAFLKCLGCGIDRGLDEVVVGRLQDLEAPVRSIHGPGMIHAEHVFPLACPKNYVGAYACASETPQVTTHTHRLADLIHD